MNISDGIPAIRVQKKFFHSVRNAFFIFQTQITSAPNGITIYLVDTVLSLRYKGQYKELVDNNALSETHDLWILNLKKDQKVLFINEETQRTFRVGYETINDKGHNEAIVKQNAEKMAIKMSEILDQL